MKLTAIILTRNEERNILKCLQALSFADEKIVIDNGSTDLTVKLAIKSNAKVLTFKGTDFSFARELGKKKAKNKWLLYIDADEIVTPRLASEIKKINPDGFSGYKLLRKNYFFGTEFPITDQSIRLINKTGLISWQGKVHETPVIKGNIGILKNPLLHYTHTDISRMVEKTNLWSEIEAELRLENKHPEMVWWRFIRVMITAFIDSFITQKSYKKGTVGFIESVYQSFSMFITYAKLWEKQIQIKKS